MEARASLSRLMREVANSGSVFLPPSIFAELTTKSFIANPSYRAISTETVA